VTARIKKPIVRLETRLLADGVYTFRDRLDIEDTLTITMVKGLSWLLEYFEIEEGEFSFASGTTNVFPRGKKCWVFYPAFSLSRPFFRRFRGTVTGMASTDYLGARCIGKPLLFESNASILETPITDILASASNLQSVELNPGASALSIRARQLIVDAFPNDPSIAQVAARLGVSNAHLSRQFRRDYGMSPREYLHQVRMADVPLRLARGETISDVSGSAGYGDLSRFYKQFAKRTRTSPGVCRTMFAPKRS
jgi:AraC-like DNA-binding protein